MQPQIPYENWQPLTVDETVALFTGAPFQWSIAGGYALELFLGQSYRPHDDIDIIVFRDEQLPMQRWLEGWQLYAADPPGTLRVWQQGEYLPVGIHDIWGHQIGVDAWQLQVMLTECEGDEWVSRRDSRIRGKRDTLITTCQGIPCIRPDVQLLYKAKSRRPKDEIDYQQVLPKLSHTSRQWLKDHLLLLYAQDHPWLDHI